MPKKQAARPGQVGEFWPSRHPTDKEKTGSWYRTWYDSADRQTRRESLDQTDFGAACDALLEWYLNQRRPQQAARAESLIAPILLAYWLDHAQHLPSAQTEGDAIALWNEFWGDRTVAELTPDEQRKFLVWLTTRTYKPTSTGKPRHFELGPAGIDRILSVGRAALERAEKYQEIVSAPHIFMVQTVQERRAAPPRGIPIGVPEIAQLVDAAEARHVLIYLVLLIGTLARPAALRELVRPCYDTEHRLVALNPPGRVQNKKYRPTLPAVEPLQPWLEHGAAGKSHYVTYRGQPLAKMRNAWSRLTTDAKLSEDVTSYSVRHGIARIMRKAKVDPDQINLWLGHLPRGADATTAIYAPYEPDYLTEAADVIREIFHQVDQRCERKIIMRSQLVVGGAPVFLPIDGMASRAGIGEARRVEVRRLIIEGVPHGEIVKRTSVSSGTVSNIRAALRAELPVLRLK